MSHEVESMFFVGKKPWHGLGVEVNEDIDLRTGLKKSGLDWLVIKEPLYLDSGQQIPDYYATVRCRADKVGSITVAPTTDDEGALFTESRIIEPGHKDILGVVGSRYEVYQNWEAFEWFEPYLNAGLVKLHTAGSLQNGRRVWILGKVNGVFTVAKNDDIELYLLLSHSHDGSLQIDVGTTPIRVVCANTLRAAQHDSASKLFRVKHSKKNIARSVQDLQANVDRLIEEFQMSMEAYRYLASKKVDSKLLRQYVEDVFDISGKKPEEISTRTRNQMDRVEFLFQQGMGNNLASVAGTAWAAYNAVTQWISYERGNSQDSRINSLWFGDSVKLNTRALNCAISLGV